MRTCWKCGEELGSTSGYECEACESGKSQTQDGVILSRAAHRKLVHIDWTKVKTFQDMLDVWSALGIHMDEGSEIAIKLKRFLRDQ